VAHGHRVHDFPHTEGKTNENENRNTHVQLLKINKQNANETNATNATARPPKKARKC